MQNLLNIPSPHHDRERLSTS